LQQAGLARRGQSHVQVLVAQMDAAELPRALGLATQLRMAGINTEVQLESKKLARQFQYADRAGIRFVVMQGADELANGTVAVKDLRRGEQFAVAEAELIKTLRVEIEQSRVMGDAALPAAAAVVAP